MAIAARRRRRLRRLAAIAIRHRLEAIVDMVERRLAAERHGLVLGCCGGGSRRVDLGLPRRDDPRSDPIEFAGGIKRRVFGDVDKGPGGADVTLAVERVALPAVRLIARIGVLDVLSPIPSPPSDCQQSNTASGLAGRSTRLISVRVSAVMILRSRASRARTLPPTEK